MIEALAEAGIQVAPVWKALVPVRNFGSTSGAPVDLFEEMDIEDAFRKLVNNPMLKIDPFSD